MIKMSLSNFVLNVGISIAIVSYTINVSTFIGILALSFHIFILVAYNALSKEERKMNMEMESLIATNESLREETVDLMSYPNGSARELSMKKQKHIRHLIRLKVCLNDILFKMQKKCGYCVKYHTYKSCDSCPLFWMYGCACDDLDEWADMIRSKNLDEFRDSHKIWCKKLGLWEDSWI